MNDSWIVNCEVCDCEIDKLDQEKGVYIVGDSENVCSEKCVEEVLGLTHLTKPKRMEARGRLSFLLLDLLRRKGV